MLLSLWLSTNLALSSPILQLSEIDERICLEDIATYWVSPDTNTPIDQILRSATFVTFDQASIHSESRAIWIKFTLQSDDHGDSIHINSKMFDEVKLYHLSNDRSATLLRSTGYLPEYQDEQVKYYGSCIDFYHPPHENRQYLLGLISHTTNSRSLATYFTSTCQKLYTSHGYMRKYKLPKHLLFFFFGGILMMSLYNLGIAVTTQYKEYVLFSLYNLCFVLIGLNLSNLPMELGWIHPFAFERNLRFLPALLGIPMYLLFAIHFLDIKTLNTRLHQFLQYLLVVFPVLIVAMLLSYFHFVFLFFAGIMAPLFVGVLYAAIIRARQHLYALYFLIGNLLLISVGVLQLVSLYGQLSIVLTTQWSIIALMLEIIFFSFAVATKMKVARKELFLMRTRNQLQRERIEYELSLKKKLEMEIEKKSRALTSSSVQWLNLSEQLIVLKKKLKTGLKENNDILYRELIKQVKEIENFENNWNSFKVHFENVYKGFFESIEKAFPILSQNDLKLCAFMKMKLSNKEIAQILNVTKKAVEQSKRRMRKKLDLENEVDLLDFIEEHIQNNGGVKQGHEELVLAKY